MNSSVILLLFVLFFEILSFSAWSLATRAFAARGGNQSPESEEKRKKYEWMAFALIGCVAIHFAYLAITRHRLFLSFGYDLGTMDQTVWNTAHGRWFEYSDPGGEIVCRPFRGRIELAYLPVALLYRFIPGPPTLLAVQSVALASGGWPLFLLAREKLGQSEIALATTFAYLLHPGVRGINLHAFHANALSVPFAIAALRFVALRRFPAAFVFALVTLACREELGIFVFALGIYVALKDRKVTWGGGLAAIGIAFTLTAWLVLPRLAGSAGLITAGKGGEAFLGRLTHGPLGLVRYYLNSPHEVIPQLLSVDNLLYLATLLGPFAFLSILEPSMLLIVSPMLVVYLLSGWMEMTQVNTHYSANTIPAVAAAAIGGAAWLRQFGSTRVPLALAGHLVVVTMFFAWFPPTRMTFIQRPFWTTEHQNALESAVLRVPPDASVISAQHVMPHLTMRRRAFAWVSRVESDVAVFDGLEPILWRGWRAPIANLRMEVISPYPDQFIDRTDYKVDMSVDGVTALRRTVNTREHIASLRELFTRSPNGLQQQDLKCGMLHLTGTKIVQYPARYGTIVRLDLRWRRLSPEAAGYILICENDVGHRYLYAHIPTFGILPEEEWKTGDEISEELLIHLPEAMRGTRCRLGVAVQEKEKPDEGDMREEPPRMRKRGTEGSAEWFGDFIAGGASDHQ